MSVLLQELYRMLSIIRTTTYHPQTDGLIEQFNGTLKAMLKKFTSRNKRDWDEYLTYLLFSFREAPQESTGRNVRGPLDIVKEVWSGEETPNSDA